MTPLERWSLHLAAMITAGSGLLEGWLKAYGERMGEFGPEAHPWLSAVQHLHVLVAPILVFTMGMMVRGHLWPRLRGGTEGRRTGLSAALLIAPMIFSGYGLQVSANPLWRSALGWTHGISAMVFLMAYVGHLAVRGRQKKSGLVTGPVVELTGQPG